MFLHRVLSSASFNKDDEHSQSWHVLPVIKYQKKLAFNFHSALKISIKYFKKIVLTQATTA